MPAHHVQQRIAYGERGGETDGHISRLAGSRQTSASLGIGLNLSLHGDNRLTDCGLDMRIPVNT